MEQIRTETEFKRFIETMGPWFEGVAKFVAIMARHNDDIYSAERLMLQKLERETFKIDKFMKELRGRIKTKGQQVLLETVFAIQERVLEQEKVAAVLAMPSADFWDQFLTDVERARLDGILDAEKLMDLCIYEPFRNLFGLSGDSHRLCSLNDESIRSRLFVAAVNDGAVSVVVGESVTPIIMDGITARMNDVFSLTELVDTDVSFIIDIGGFQIEFGKVSYPGEHL